VSQLNPYLQRHIGEHAALAGRVGLEGLRSLAEDHPELSDRLAEALDAASVEYRLRGRLDEAVKASEEAVEILRDPDDVVGQEKQNLLLSALQGLSASYAKVGRLDDATRVMREFEQLRARLSAKTASSASPIASLSTEIATEAAEFSHRRASDTYDYESLANAEQKALLYRGLAEVSRLHRPELADALIDLAAALSGANQQERALTFILEANEMSRELVLVDLSLRSVLARGLIVQSRLLAGRGDYHPAFESAEEATRIRRELLGPDQPSQEALSESLLELSMRYCDTGGRDEAVSIAEEAVGLSRHLAEVDRSCLPLFAQALVSLGVAYSQAARPLDALAPTEEAVQLYRPLAADSPGFLPDLARALNNLGTVYSQTGRRADALAPTEEAVQLYRPLAADNPGFLPDLSRALSNLGSRLAEIGRRMDALAPTEEAVHLRRSLVADRPGFLPDLARALNYLGTVYSQAGRRLDALAPTEEAVQLYRPLATDNPGFLPELARALTSRGRSYRSMERYDAAIADFSLVIDFGVDVAGAIIAEAIRERGETYLLMGRLDEAIADFTQAIEVDSGFVPAIISRGRAYTAAGRYEQAIADFTRAINLDPDGTRDVMEWLKSALEHVSPGPAQKGEIIVYLKTLIDWLNIDPWPQDLRFGGPTLTPAAIEAPMRIRTGGFASEEEFDADELAKQCRRLVILGGPGSGKTWLARRTARRCAEVALLALTDGESLDEVELPLYTTCSRLFIADGGIRDAVVSSSLDQLGDLGEPRLSAAVHTFFTERTAPTLLVLDSLHEAHGPDDRLRQADTLPWRIVLTSRPNSWNGQLAVNDRHDFARVGELQPLRAYDVETFIQRWFHQRPEQGRDLASQIGRHPGLQQAATVPLILAFYCIVGGQGRLPDFTSELYRKVLNRMLTGRWRGSMDQRPDIAACLQVLRAWAWAGATRSDPVSGIGTWADAIVTQRVQLSAADRDAVDNVAPPISPPDIDTGMVLRRFVHRSIREYLVAENVASLSVEQAAEALLPHMWYDPDWEYVAPTSVAMHPQRDQLLRKLICRAANSDQIPTNLAVIDAWWEFRGFLARVASESSKTDWPQELETVITQAQLDLAQSGRIDKLSVASSWQTSKHQTRDALLRRLADQTDNSLIPELVDSLIQRVETAEDRRLTRDTLLSILVRETSSSVASALVDGLVQLVPTAREKRLAREKLLGLLAEPTHETVTAELVNGVIRLARTAEDQYMARESLIRLLAEQGDGAVAAALAEGVMRLDPSPVERAVARESLIRLLAEQGDGAVAERSEAPMPLDPTVRDLSARPDWPISLTAELLATTRRNSTLADWIATLPALAPLSG
jgi:tetratricopeptide (TPR) repeat protein